jgi:hypothetical protein
VERRSILIVGGAVLVGLAVFVAWSLGPGRNRNESSRLTEITDPETIRKSVELTHLSIMTSDTFAGNIRIRNITGRLKNISPTPIRKIDLKMTFTDYDGKTIQESTHTAFSPRKQPLDPGTQFQLRDQF